MPNDVWLLHSRMSEEGCRGIWVLSYSSLGLNPFRTWVVVLFMDITSGITPTTTGCILQRIVMEVAMLELATLSEYRSWFTSWALLSELG